jgi:DMSO reductase anchor subunit
MVDWQIRPSKRQRSWGWLAVSSLSLGGAGAGFYLIGSLLTFLGHSISDQNQFVSFQIFAPVLVCCAFLALSIEAGRPFRAYRLFNLFSGSWMSIESLAGAIFIITALCNWFFQLFILSILTVSAALMFMISQGCIFYRAAAVTAWNVRLIPIIFVTSGIMTGCGLTLLNTRFHSGMDALPMVVFLMCIFLNSNVWLFYLYGHHDKDFKEATWFLRSPAIAFVIMGLGHSIPFILLFSIVVFGNAENGFKLSATFSVISGILLVLGGSIIKAGITIAAGYYRKMLFKTVKNTN